MKFHKLAKYFPLLDGEDFDLLVESIRKNGQREPIVTYEGQILDGINRYRACDKLGIEPKYRPLPDGDDPLQYVVDANIRRRHMDTSQRAMLATEMEPEFAERVAEQANEARRGAAKAMRPEGSKHFAPSERSEDRRPDKEAASARAQTAKVFGVSGPTIQRAKRVKEEAPDKVADIVSGKTTVNAVDAELRAKHAAERAATKREQQTEQRVKETPKAVKEYFDALHSYKRALEFAVEVAQRDLFSPEALQMVKTRHEQVRRLMAQMEGVSDEG